MVFRKEIVPAPSTSPKVTTIRLPSFQKSIASKSKKDRSLWIEDALKSFLSWDTYLKANWDVPADDDALVWLDSVEIGVEYRTKTTLEPPVQISLSPDVIRELEKACAIVERQRPGLQGRGIASGIIRSAIEMKRLEEGAL